MTLVTEIREQLVTLQEASYPALGQGLEKDIQTLKKISLALEKGRGKEAHDAEVRLTASMSLIQTTIKSLRQAGRFNKGQVAVLNKAVKVNKANSSKSLSGEMTDGENTIQYLQTVLPVLYAVLG